MFELIYTINNCRALKKYKTLDGCYTFIDRINAQKWEIFKQDPQFHSTLQEEFLVAKSL